MCSFMEQVCRDMHKVSNPSRDDAPGVFSFVTCCNWGASDCRSGEEVGYAGENVVELFY